MDVYGDHFVAQVGGGEFDLRIGPVFRSGFVRQRGRGIGSIFRNIISFVSPLFKSGAQALGRAVLSTGANIASDIAASDGSATSIKEIAKRRSLETRDAMAKKMRGGGARRRRRSQKIKAKRTTRKKKVTRRTRRRRATKRSKLDIFTQGRLG